MQRPRVQFTVRGLMIIVVLVALVLSAGILKQRRDERLKKLAFFVSYEQKYQARAADYLPGEPSIQVQERLNYFTVMRQKWERAASRPWLSVVPDPSESWE